MSIGFNLTWHELRLSVRLSMKLLHSKQFLRILAALAVLLFVGDLAADTIADMAGGHCAPQTSQSTPNQEKSPCSHCSCATHIGAVVVADFAMRIGADAQPADILRGDDGTQPIRLAASIDHPPQLS